jgi:hypothetical protein
MGRIEVRLTAHQRHDGLPSSLRLSNLGENRVDGGGAKV